jgi:regulator of replication initiation timing
MKPHTIPLARCLAGAAVCALAFACATGGDQLHQGQETRTSIFTDPPQAQSVEPPRLYARDGTVVAGPEDVSALEPQRREVGEGASGRMVLLELYQNVIEERDALSLEVTALRAELEKAQAAQRAAEAEALAQTSKVEVLEVERDRLTAEGLELAGRLTTAQIRRLQAEKLLLEHKIAEQRSRVASAQAEGRP